MYRTAFFGFLFFTFGKYQKGVGIGLGAFLILLSEINQHTMDKLKMSKTTLDQLQQCTSNNIQAHV